MRIIGFFILAGALFLFFFGVEYTSYLITEFLREKRHKEKNDG